MKLPFPPSLNVFRSPAGSFVETGSAIGPGADVAPVPETSPETAPDQGPSLAEVAALVERAAAGDLEARIVHLPSDPDFARLCQAVNRVLDISDAFVREASAAMAACSREEFHRPILLRGLPGSYRKGAEVINEAGRRLRDCSDQLGRTGRLATETAENVTVVAAACEELTASTNEISRQTDEASKLTDKAVREADAARAAMDALSDVGRRINSVVGHIRKIASQTNLLALNATIEAARAGEHGKGFAVVATEVKELSRSSAQATEDIGREVERMQASARSVATSVGGIGESIRRLHAGAGTIANSLAEQVEATGEITRHLSDISERSRRISDGIRSLSHRGVTAHQSVGR